MNNVYFLSEDKYSNFPPKHGNEKRMLYGKKGTEVTEVSRNGDVLIVEDKKANRFSINIKLLILKK